MIRVQDRLHRGSRGRRAWLSFALPALLLPVTASAQTADRVVTRSGTVTGRIVASDAGEVQVEDRSGETKRIAVDQIREVVFGGEPQELKAARSMLARGRAAEALEELGKIQPGDLDGAEPLLLAEVASAKAIAAARAALASGGDPREPGKQVAEFLARNPQSHRTYEMQELLGDLLARAGLPDKALAEYAKLSKGPAAFQVRAASARAAMLLEQQKYAEALAEYDAALRVDADDDAGRAQKRAAEIGRARCLANLGQAEEATAQCARVIAQADPEDAATLAAAYAALGGACRAIPGREQDALIAYLTVDLVYNSSPDSHAEALYHLVELWDKAAKPERAREARAMLESAYPGSRWAKRLGGSKS